MTFLETVICKQLINLPIFIIENSSQSRNIQHKLVNVLKFITLTLRVVYKTPTKFT